jgi:phosphatidylinositol alpha-1,6-mannosyltransferase
MKVLFITRKWPPAVGGMEQYSWMLTRKLKPLCELEVRALSGREDGRPASILSLTVFVCTNAFRLLKNVQKDVLHIGDLVLWPLGVVAQLRNPTIRCFITAYGLDIVYGYRSGLLPCIYRWYLRFGVWCSSHWLNVVAISNATAQLCNEVGFEHVAVIPLGVDVDGGVVAGQRNELKMQPYVLFVGRLVRRKGAAWFADQVLSNLASDTKFVVVGAAWDKNEHAALIANPRVEYLGVVSTEKIRALRKHAVAVVMPNIPTEGKDIEGFGLTALEAAADGGVLVASGIEGITDAVVDGQTGFLLPALDPQAWAEKIQEIRTWTCEGRAAFVGAAQAVIKERYSWQRVARDTYRLYHESKS